MLTPEHAKAGDRVTVTAHAFWGNQWIAKGVAFRGMVTSPDGSVSSFSLTPSIDPLVGARGEFTASGNTGLHEVRVSCDVGRNAVFGAGEYSLAPDEPYEPNPGTVEPFYREATVSLPVAEPSACTGSPYSLACCTSLSACPGTRDVGIFTGFGDGGGGSGQPGFSGLELADRARVTGPAGKPTQLVSGAPEQTEFGASSHLHGSVFSTSSVFGRERTHVSGALQIEPQATVRTSGAAPTRIFVEGQLSMKEAIRHSSARHDRLLVLTLGHEEVFVEQALSGTLVAPYASVTLGGQENTVHRGAVFARGVRLRAGVILEHHGFPWTWVPGGAPVLLQTEAAARPMSGSVGTQQGSGGCQLAQSPGQVGWLPWASLLALFWVRGRRRQTAA